MEELSDPFQWHDRPHRGTHRRR